MTMYIQQNLYILKNIINFNDNYSKLKALRSNNYRSDKSKKVDAL